jgi:hypothetical protein
MERLVGIDSRETLIAPPVQHFGGFAVTALEQAVRGDWVWNRGARR